MPSRMPEVSLVLGDEVAAIKLGGVLEAAPPRMNEALARLVQSWGHPVGVTGLVADVLRRAGGLGCRVGADGAIDHDDLFVEVGRREERVLQGGVVHAHQGTCGGCQRVKGRVDPLQELSVHELQLAILRCGWSQHGSTTAQARPSGDGGVRLCHVGVDSEAPVATFGGRWATICDRDRSHVRRENDRRQCSEDMAIAKSKGRVKRALGKASHIKTQGITYGCSTLFKGLVNDAWDKAGGFRGHAGGAEHGVRGGGQEGVDLGTAILSGAEEGCAHDEGSDFEHVCFHIFVSLVCFVWFSVGLGFLGLGCSKEPGLGKGGNEEGEQLARQAGKHGTEGASLHA